MAKHYRQQNNPVHRRWTLFQRMDKDGHYGTSFAFVGPVTFIYWPGPVTETYDASTLFYVWDTDAATSIAHAKPIFDPTDASYIIFTILGTNTLFVIREDLHDAALDTGPDYGDLWWVINGRLEERQV